MRYFAPLLLLALILFSGCSSNGNSYDDQSASPGGQVPQAILDSLPPDPGDINNETVDGVDSDNDGVRDDIQRMIVLSSYQDTNYMNAQLMFAKSTQMMLTVPLETGPVVEVAHLMSRSMACLSEVSDPDRDRIYKKTDKIIKEQLNSDSRVRRYSEYGKILSGNPTGGISASATAADLCDFNVQ